MNVTKKYTLEVFNTNDTENNLKISVELDKFTKMLSMTDNFVLDNIVTEDKVIIEDNNNTVVLRRDDNGTTVNDLLYIATINSNTNTENNFYYHKVDKIIINIPTVNSLDVDNLKGVNLTVKGTYYGNSIFNDNNNLKKHFLNKSSSLLNNLSLPNTLVGKEISIINLTLTGLDLVSNVKYAKKTIGDVDIAINDLIVDFLFIKNVDLGLDNKTTLFTINAYGVYSKEVIQLSSFNDPTYIILPLL